MLAQIEVAFAEKSTSEERLRQFVADASHELRTPLTSIRGYAELLRRGGFSDEAGINRALQRVEEEATRMGGLVEDLLLLAELDRGRPLRAEPVDLHRICADVVDDSNASDHSPRADDGPGRRGRRPGGRRATDPGGPQPGGQCAGPHPAGLARSRCRPAPKGAWASSWSPTTDRASIPPWPRGSSTVSRGGTPDGPVRGPGWGWPSCAPIAEALGGSAAVTSPAAGGTSIVVRIPLAPADVRRAASAGVAGVAASAGVAAAEPLSAGVPSLRAPGTRGPRSA